MVEIWDIDSSESVSFPTNALRTVAVLRFSKCGEFVVIGGHTFFQLWYMSSKSLKQLWSVDSDVFTGRKQDSLVGCDFSADEQSIYTGHQSGKINVWNISTEKCIRTIEIDPSGPMSCLAIYPSRDGDRLATAYSPGSWAIRIWDLDSGKNRELPTHGCKDREGWEQIHFSSDGNYLAVGSRWVPISDDHDVQHAPFELVVKEDGWIARLDKDDSDLLWLPPEYRPGMRGTITRGGIAVIGSESGRAISMELTRPD
jgi:WD40 repeat protein